MIAHETPYASPVHPPSFCRADCRQTTFQRSLMSMGLAGVGALAFLLAVPAMLESSPWVVLASRRATLLWIALFWERGARQTIVAMVRSLTDSVPSPKAFLSGLALFTAHGILGFYGLLAVETVSP
ncbi:MAG TPA: hypothetical protein VGM06_23945 [Polyangiaceae bacterium]|jgi:hypothetical protein